MEQQNKEKRKLKMNRMQWTIAAGVLILAVVLVYALVKNNKVASSYEVVTSMSRGDDTSVYYCMMRKGMVKYSKDGVAMTNKSGTVLWNQTYEMASPTMTSAGDYVAVGDIRANTIYIFNEYGQLGRVSTDVPIQEIQISEQGVVAAVLSLHPATILTYMTNRETAWEVSRLHLRIRDIRWQSPFHLMRRSLQSVI